MKKMFAVLSLALMLMVGVASADMHEATVYVVHGIPGVVVDVEVVGVGCALPGFQFGDIAGPLSLPEGTYNIKIRPTNAMDPCSEMPVIDVDVSFAAGENVTVVAYLDDMGNPTASKFDNDFSPTGRGKARLIVHHTAYAPTVDIKVSRNGGNSPEVMVTDFSNGDQAAAETRPGEWYVSIMPAGDMTPVFGPIMVELEPFTAYRIYAVGDVAGGTFTLLVFPYDGLK
jgi:hypothetical protein